MFHWELDKILKIIVCDWWCVMHLSEKIQLVWDAGKQKNKENLMRLPQCIIYTLPIFHNSWLTNITYVHLSHNSLHLSKMPYTPSIFSHATKITHHVVDHVDPKYTPNRIFLISTPSNFPIFHPTTIYLSKQ